VFLTWQKMEKGKKGRREEGKRRRGEEEKRGRGEEGGEGEGGGGERRERREEGGGQVSGAGGGGDVTGVGSVAATTANHVACACTDMGHEGGGSKWRRRAGRPPQVQKAQRAGVGVGVGAAAFCHITYHQLFWFCFRGS
jgi:hypothetical protein